jgi:microcystin-dependent protein
LQPYSIGQVGGAETVQLNANTTPAHTHGFAAFAAAATASAPSAALPAQAHGTGRGAFAINSFASTGNATTLAPSAVAPASGGGQAHNNLQPYLAMNWCIALFGIFPSRQ